MIGDCFNCKHNMYVGECDFICDLSMVNLTIENFIEPAEDFLGCGGEGWEEEE